MGASEVDTKYFKIAFNVVQISINSEKICEKTKTNLKTRKLIYLNIQILKSSFSLIKKEHILAITSHLASNS
jgi:hypothetical protein